MSNLVACQPGWLVVFEEIDAVDGFFTEPIACWQLAEGPCLTAEVRPICALGGDVCDASDVANYVGVVGPGGDPKKLVAALQEARRKETA
jgi:hypothetical protein